ncbi:4-alpha-glucanotransferase [Oscillatoria sp. CS-180]|uniref:4-alpha-glucanotransferase n=1 Tax=Oscillatoria sp. CS-180 TaxID=3021720 RepID=UPI00232D1C75|nr:4-alpha-glucanotransferase [Oscillatoria sp. CS-180]MDB9525683.1 4-alpha-glucanotransferase [Oscillatoria sp. CS-180]
MPFQRSSGIILHPTSLPGRFGIGDLGKAAYEFVDFLEQSGQKIWQILPLGPTGYEHSPYTMNFSAFAGNPLLISLEQLAKEGLLQADQLEPLSNSETSNRVDFDQVIPYKTQYLKQAFQKFQPDDAFHQFCQEQAYWLDDYVLFMALLEANDGKEWSDWDKAIARREPDALKAQAEALKDEIQYHRFVQFKFFEQWKALRAYTNHKDIQIVGDVSIYVCYNSADVWADPQCFKLDPETLKSTYIAGVPPDYFSATGQLWGNPVYDWDYLERTDFSWWVKRFRATLEYVDIVRIDHFRAFEAYWQVPAGEETAMNGEWVEAPGYVFFETLGDRLGSLPVLAEDLGIITPEVEALRDHFEFPGMRILLFAFGDTAENLYQPHNYVQNCAVYVGTHDNDTAMGWWEQGATDPEKAAIARYLGLPSPDAIQEINWTLLRLAFASVADLAIVQLQDVMGLGHDGRMNDPSTPYGNWRWRYPRSEDITEAMTQRLLEVTQTYRR